MVLPVHFVVNTFQQQSVFFLLSVLRISTERQLLVDGDIPK